MTIAACYVSPEGIVLGADSTSTYANGGADHYFNQGQKLFEIGSGGNLGVVTWGLGGLGVSSYRRLIALLADDLDANPHTTVEDVVNRWIIHFWAAYSTILAPIKDEYDILAAKSSFNPALQPSNAMRTEAEENRFQEIPIGHYVGFCIGGHVLSDRTPKAYTTHFDITKPMPVADQLDVGPYLWGAPNLVVRQIKGYDDRIKSDILTSGKWSGTEAELSTILDQYGIGHSPTVPIREAIDFVYSCIFSTIKALKFSSFSQICGGPIEIAAITADRSFRWVRHKSLGQALNEGDAG